MTQMDQPADTRRAVPTVARGVLIPLALAQFICSFAGSNMNVMINDISEDLNTTVKGVQTAITVFLLVMAALMIPGGKLTDRYGRVRLFRLGLAVYGVGAVISAVSPGLGVTGPVARDCRDYPTDILRKITARRWRARTSRRLFGSC